MKLNSLKNKIIKLGGKADIKERTSNYAEGIGWELEGELNNCIIEMSPNFGEDDTSFYTVSRPGTEYDHGSDYNPHGYIFCHRLNDLEWACKLEGAK